MEWVLLLVLYVLKRQTEFSIFYLLKMQTLLQISLKSAGSWLQELKSQILAIAPGLIGALIVLIVGLWLIKLFYKMLTRIMARRQYDPSLQNFLLSLFKAVLNVLLIITVAGMVGINTTSFAALIAGAGLAIGIALNGSLGNLAGGVMMLIFKPFKVGDVIEAQGAIGGVQQIGIFSTILLSAENKTIIVPNGPLSTGIIVNYTTAGYLRVDINLAIAPNMDIDKARKVAIEAMLTHEKVLKTPAPEVAVQKIGDGMITLAIRPYCNQADYWDVNFGIQELVYKAWDVNGIEGPTPHRVIVNKSLQPTSNLPAFG
jgi:small conductance mechanosensitive channel